MDVLLGRESIPIDRAVFTTLLVNSVAGTYVGYEHALESGSIKYAVLVDLARKGDIPFALFFAPLPVVQEQVKLKTKKLLAGVNRETFSIGSRSKVELRDVELIIEDLIRKQQLLRKHDSSLQRNRIMGLLRDHTTPIDADAARLMSALGLSSDALRASTTKEKALDLMIDRLEANQVLVSRSVQHYMPQRLTHVKFSGMTIRDNKVPFIFLAGGDHGDDQEPVGRTIFTLALMAVLVARRIFAPMTWDGGSTETNPGREYDIAGAMLMPADRMQALRPASLEDMKTASNDFKVTASAVTVRAMRLEMISGETAADYLSQLRDEFRKTPTGGPRSQIHPWNAVRKYNGRELTVRMLHALDGGEISQGDFCRSICLNKLKPSSIDELRRAVE
ncbi:hypothetical protein NF556_19255 [Ornithinimicrobium faecis]|uniref:Uncharacterized protein n=1 Tax=Ornithinimicrobium faecis TaxID=2934158 RepID=A0ABY4YSY8_9MICO|nr:hypothetical protein [Ornithinimicrobium sp. HY1793]USQ79699.1 hypothetical protein NF556_19255 [Ornithinimicrobium sp. HY1793]